MFDVVMPLYNKEEFVRAAIESVLAQTFQDWKLIVVDDGSTDASLSLARGFDDPRITVMTQANAGPGAARNTGIAFAQAEWIALLDADDFWLHEHLAELDALRRQFPEAILIGAGYRSWDGRESAERAALMGPTCTQEIRYFYQTARDRSPFCSSSAAFSLAGIPAGCFFKTVIIGEDTEFWARLALHGPVAASLRRTALIRVGTGGLTDIYMSNGEPDRPPPSTFAEVSPALATLAAAIDDIRDERLRRDIDGYVDYELGIALLRAVRLNEIAYARGLLPLFRRRPRGKAGVAARLAALPPPAGQWLIRSIFKAKRLARSARPSRARG